MADNSVPANPLTIGQSQATTWSPATLNAKAASDAAFADSKDAYAAWAAAGKPESGPEKQAVVDALNTSQAAQQATVNAMNNDPQDTPVAPPNAGQIAKDDGPTTNSSPGAGAGTTNNAATSVGADDSPKSTSSTAQQALAVFTTSTNQNITPQPNQLDQYASYTYGISWYVLSEAQFKDMVKTQKPNITGWQLLMQSAGSPITGRSPAFPLDYYMDDIEIDSYTPAGNNMCNSATAIKFRVVEPNGISLIQNLFNAVTSVYKTPPPDYANQQGGEGGYSAPPQTTQAPNYLAAQYCLVVQFYGYDSQGKLVAPAKGQYSTSGGYGQQAVIVKYYPFILADITFRMINRAIEYTVTGKPIVQFYNSSTDRGTIPFDFVMTGQTVEQLLSGSPVSTGNSGPVDTNARDTTPAIPVPPTLPSIVTGQDNPLATPGGMDFTAGNF